MLVLTRKVGEVINIGDGVTVKVSSIEGYRVKLAFDAPPEVQIDRLEVHEEKQRREKSNGDQ